MRAFLVVRHGDVAVVESLLSLRPALRLWPSEPLPSLYLEAPGGDALSLLRGLPEAFLAALEASGAERLLRVYLEGFSLDLEAELLALLGRHAIALSVWRAVP